MDTYLYGIQATMFLGEDSDDVIHASWEGGED